VQRPLTILMGILALVLMGGVAYTYLKVDRLPPLTFPIVIVTVFYPQATAQDVEALVSKPIEDALAGVPGASGISSTSSEGRSRVRIEFAEGVNLDLATLDVDRRMARVRARLPADSGEPSVRKIDPSEIPIMNVALTGAPLDQLFDIANDQLQPALQSIVGVGSVDIFGGLQREVQIRVDYGKLAARNLSVAQVSNALAAGNVAASVGTFEQAGQLLNIRAIGDYQTPADLQNLVVAQTPGGTVLLRDVATVREAFKEVRQLQRLNGEDAVGLTIVKVSDANALQVAAGVKAVLDQIRPTLPSGAQIQVRNDNSFYIRASLDAIQHDLILAVILVGLVTFLFLHAWRNVLIIVLSIPTSIVSTFLVMYLMGFTLNLMTLMALALMIGILVDSSIVVIENIHRHFHMGKDAHEAALVGRQEIGLATIAIAAADVIVYLPIAFMAGGVGQLFRQYGITVVVATLFSLLISFTLTPMLASRWLRRETQGDGLVERYGRRWDAGFARLSEGVGRVVRWAVRSRWRVAAGCGLLVAVSAAMIQLRVVGSEYAPVEDDNNFQVTLTTPSGASLQATDDAARQLEALLGQIPEIESMFTSVVASGGSAFGGSTGRATIGVQLVPKHERHRSSLQIIQEVRRLGRQVPGATVSARPSSSLPGAVGSGRLDVDVIGPELDTLQRVVEDVKAAMARVPGMVDVEDSGTQGVPELHIVLDSARMAQLNVTSQQAIDALRTTLGGRVASVLRPTGKLQQDITVIAADTDRQNLVNLGSIPVRGGATLNPLANVNNLQPVVTLGQIATITYGTGPVEIQRINRNRTISVGGTAAGRSLGDVAADMRGELATISLPPGYTVRTGRQVNQFNDALRALGQALMLAVMLEYMLLVALYQSWTHPLVLILSVPLGLVGSIFGLALTGYTINVFSLMGLVMAFGLVAKNGILLIDYTNTLRERGIERTEALAEAARTRLRPILMTSATMVCGMLPLALSMEAGSESRAPMAVVVIGAILTSTALAILVLPAMYVLLEDLQVALAAHRWALALPARAPAAGAAGVLAADHQNGRRWAFGRTLSAIVVRRNGRQEDAPPEPAPAPAAVRARGEDG
jgi:HAE1 family hydrophobic/amphiphilic exporter-1